MNTKTLATLEFDKILARLARHTAFSAGRALALALRPSSAGHHPTPQPLVLSLSKDDHQERLG